MSRPLDRFFLDRPKSSRRRRTRSGLPVARSVPRVRALLIAVAVVFSVAAGRAVQVQAIDASNVAAEAADQMTVTQVLPAFRGEITDRNGEVLAFTEDTVKVVANPRMIATNGKMNNAMSTKDQEVAATAPAKLAALLAHYLGGAASDYLSKLSGSGQYQVVSTKVPAATWRALRQAVSDADLVGLSSVSAPTRRYPNGTLASNVLGFVNSSGEAASGLGLEYALNSTLAGTDGKEVYEDSPNGKIPLGTNVITPAVNGQDYQVTLDAALQWQAEQLLAKRVKATGAKSGRVIITNPKTGEILALANYPSFNSNSPGTANSGDLGNRAVSDAYTPGSVQKTLTMAALIDQGLVKSNEVVTVPGKIKSGSDWVSDAWKHGTIKLYPRGIVAKSSNVGTIELARRATKQSLHDYMVRFGLGTKTSIGLPGEAAGTLPAADMPDYARDGMAFGGSAVAVTLVQEAAAIGALANGGVYTPLQLVKSKTLADGSTQAVTSGTSHRVVSVDTASEVLSMMEAMAQSSSKHIFDVSGYRVGAKTGTSKSYDTKCKCFNGLVTSAISVAPVENPQVLVYAVFDKPKRGGSGSAVAGPLVQQLTQLALVRYGVAQSSTKAPKLAIEP